MGLRVTAAQAHHLAHRAVDLDHRARGRCPATWCRPSTFWVTSSVEHDRVRSSVDQRPVPGVGPRRPGRRLEALAPGPASDVGVGEVGVRGWPASRRSGSLVHTPFGPRKSGMPESVEMPAPVRTTTRPCPPDQRSRPRPASRDRRPRRRRCPGRTAPAAAGSPLWHRPARGSLARRGPRLAAAAPIAQFRPACGRPRSSPTSGRGCRPWPSASWSRPAPTTRCGPGWWPPPPSCPWACCRRSGVPWPTDFDRRRWLIVITTVAETGFAALLAVLAATGRDEPAAMVARGLRRRGAPSSLGFPVVPGHAARPRRARDDLLAAVSLSSAQFNLGRVIGPALAGRGPGGELCSVGLRHQRRVVRRGRRGAAAWCACPARAGGTGEGIVGRIADGARVALAEPGCRSAIVLIAVVALIGSPFIGLVPAVAIEGLHCRTTGRVGTAVLVTGQGIGAVIGALVLPGWRAARPAPPARRGAVRPPGACCAPTRGPVGVDRGGGPRRGGGRVHRRALGAQHGGAAARTPGRPGPGPESLHDGPRDHLPDRGGPPGGGGRQHRDPPGHGRGGPPPPRRGGSGGPGPPGRGLGALGDPVPTPPDIGDEPGPPGIVPGEAPSV